MTNLSPIGRASAAALFTLTVLLTVSCGRLLPPPVSETRLGDGRGEVRGLLGDEARLLAVVQRAGGSDLYVVPDNNDPRLLSTLLGADVRGLAGTQASTLVFGSIDQPKRLTEAWLVGVDALGRKQFQVIQGSAGPDMMLDAIKLSAGPLIIAAGYTTPPGSAEQGWVLVIDPKGGVLGTHRYGGGAPTAITALAEGAAGKVVLAGRQNGNAWLAAVGGQGEILWERTYHPGQLDAVRVGAGGELTVAGNADGLWAARSDAGGQLLQQRRQPAGRRLGATTSSGKALYLVGAGLGVMSVSTGLDDPFTSPQPLSPRAACVHKGQLVVGGHIDGRPALAHWRLP